MQIKFCVDEECVAHVRVVGEKQTIAGLGGLAPGLVISLIDKLARKSDKRFPD